MVVPNQKVSILIHIGCPFSMLHMQWLDWLLEFEGIIVPFLVMWSWVWHPRESLRNGGYLTLHKNGFYLLIYWTLSWFVGTRTARIDFSPSDSWTNCLTDCLSRFSAKKIQSKERFIQGIKASQHPSRGRLHRLVLKVSHLIFFFKTGHNVLNSVWSEHNLKQF